MGPRTGGFALAAGVAAFIVVGVTATVLGTASGIEFSLFVGIPAGLVAAGVAAAVVLVRYEDPAPDRRRSAVALAGFGVAFVVPPRRGRGPPAGELRGAPRRGGRRADGGGRSVPPY